MVFLVFHDWVVRPVSARVKRDAWVYVLSFRNIKACKIGCTRHTLRRRLQEWRCKDKSKGFKLVYSVWVSKERMFGIKHEAHQQVLKYTHKSNGACLNCSSKHQEEFVFIAAFGLRDACDAIDMAKELSVTNQFTTVMAVVSNYSLALDIKPKIAWTENQEKPPATLLDPLVLTTRSITDKYCGLLSVLDKICNEEEAEELGIEESMVWYPPDPAPAPQLPIPALSHVKRRKVRQEKIMVSKPTPPSLTIKDHLERLMDKLSMWQLMGDLDPPGTPKARKKGELDWMQLFCHDIIEPQTLFTSPVENEEKEAAKDDASADIDT
ncbi:hypothetical protein D9758_010799 [Tetrapyrgos nigripes]|uniref:Bacteriophage T5 Orf172 DNA-binding domain-containing protein n=1 Tax=Tetrapyrgos nigripes TaxID=182062 RepID=A0A8H5FYI3_9AGAR|nr:hypothetical protein D9758_010799 [Tetrapyrgos nigripes]